MAIDTKALILQAKATSLATMQRAADARARVEAQEQKLNLEVEGLARAQVNLIFGVDATASREAFWQTSSNIQASLFFSVDRLGITTNVQLAFYSGTTQGSVLPVTRWHNSPQSLADEMSRISCVAGATQIGKVMSHALQERMRHRIDAVVIVADSCEEQEKDLVRLGRQLRESGIKVFIFDDEKRSSNRYANTTRIFRSVARAADGQHVPFDEKSLGVLPDFLKNAAIVSTGSPLAAKFLEREMVTPEGRAMARRNLHILNSHIPR